MNLITATAIGLGLALAPLAAPIAAHAIPLTCEHRGITHVERHGGTVKDREYHLARGERVSCEADEPESKRYDRDRNWHIGQDKHRWWRND